MYSPRPPRMPRRCKAVEKIREKICWPRCLSLAASGAARNATAPAIPIAPPVTSGGEAEFFNQLLAIVSEAAITHIDARVSLESLAVDKGRIHLTGLLLQNLDVGLRLNTRGARRVAEMMQNRLGATPQARQWAPILEILKLGVFDRIEVGVRLRELRVRRLSVRADRLDVQGLLLQVGVTPNDPATGKPRGDTLQTLIAILRRTALSRVKATAALEKLAARRINLATEGVALSGLSIGVLLARRNEGPFAAGSSSSSSSGSSSNSSTLPGPSGPSGSAP